ncbi:hypothetical protein SCHPADRAFT_909621 [Schizopora paradoxa]|uniref:Uncharacterized protein n=1 Tax=Schizopora paradoxa TaxID=27342 RepID=A0A0H2R684_9AGAM|nr:hypothetical protein SCHPADRAFT_909621 [Schizopora paradoxa]
MEWIEMNLGKWTCTMMTTMLGGEICLRLKIDPDLRSTLVLYTGLRVTVLVVLPPADRKQKQKRRHCPCPSSSILFPATILLVVHVSESPTPAPLRRPGCFPRPRSTVPEDEGDLHKALSYIQDDLTPGRRLIRVRMAAFPMQVPTSSSGHRCRSSLGSSREYYSQKVRR